MVWSNLFNMKLSPSQNFRLAEVIWTHLLFTHIDILLLKIIITSKIIINSLLYIL